MTGIPQTRFARLASFLVSSSLLVGCAVGPNFHHLKAPTIDLQTVRPVDLSAQASGPAGGAQTLTPGADISADWWSLYQSPALNALIEKALKHNSDLAAAKAALKGAKETYLAQLAVFLPTVDVGASTSRNKSSTYLSPVLNASQFYYNLQTAQVNVGYTPDVFGGLRRQTEGVKAAEDLQRFQTQAVYVTLTANVVTAAIQASSLREQVKAQEAVIEDEKRILAILRRKLETGEVAQADYLAQVSALAQAQQGLPPLRKALQQENDRLAYLVGEAPSDKVSEGLTLATLTLPRNLPLSLPSALVNQRPDVRQAEANLHAASAAVGVAIAARLPSFTLSGAAGGSSNLWKDIFNSSNSAWSLGAGITQPIFEGGALYHRQKAAEAGLVQAKEQYRSAVLAALQNVSDTLAALDADAAALDSAALAKKSADETLAIVRRQLAVGQVSGVELLNAEQAERQAELSLVQAQASRFSDTAALFQALGGGWWNSAKPLFDANAERIWQY